MVVAFLGDLNLHRIKKIEITVIILDEFLNKFEYNLNKKFCSHV